MNNYFNNLHYDRAQEAMIFDADFLREAEARKQAELVQLQAELDAIDNPSAAVPAQPAPKPRTWPQPLSFADPDPNDPDVIIHVPKLTRYDRRFLKLRELQAKRDTLLAKPDRTGHDCTRLAILNELVEKAQKRLDAERRRGLTDLGRKQDGIDEWRAGDGRETYNAKRRKIRTEPNEDLSHLTPAEKKQRENDKNSDRNFRTRCDRDKKKNWTEEQIVVALAARAETRRLKREEEAEEAAELAAIKANAIA